ncbi:MAG: glycosyl transferase family 1 [Chloroflexi bacterium HGW-Chloroflexi-10]|nr:MAG: glycosyl transferase family 1 [Chloroflexi bacterium HGW-Chloroflexi-10]
MRIGHLSFRLAGTDGVSLETAKIAQVFARHGHQNYYFAGELDPEDQADQLVAAPLAGQILVPEAHFTHPEALWITKHAFGTTQMHPQLQERIETLATKLEAAVVQFIGVFNLELLTIQNVFAIPLHLPLSLAVQRALQKTGIAAIAHHHDFYWEREAYRVNCVAHILETCFPPHLPNLRHMVINSQAQSALAGIGVHSMVLPNIFDFHEAAPGVDEYNADLRSELGLVDSDLFFLQPTRVIPRKGIELAIELVQRLDDLPIKLVISHHAEHNTLDYLNEMLALAARNHVDLRYLPARFKPQRVPGKGVHKVYSLWDAYVFADFVTYPSLYEGFGNALLETIFFSRPFLVNRYAIYQKDIEPLGLDAVVVEGKITDRTVAEVRTLLGSPTRVQRMVQHNLEVGRQHFSYETAWNRLYEILQTF